MYKYPSEYNKLTNAELKYFKWKYEKVYSQQVISEKENCRLLFELYLLKCELKKRGLYDLV